MNVYSHKYYDSIVFGNTNKNKCINVWKLLIKYKYFILKIFS